VNPRVSLTPAFLPAKEKLSEFRKVPCCHLHGTVLFGIEAKTIEQFIMS
jgi:hypothetical protein